MKGQPENKGQLRVEKFERNEDGSYTVDLAGKQTDSVWVAQRCERDGEDVSAQYLPVPHGGGTTDSFAIPAADSCKAYVWKYPDTHTPISDEIIFQPSA